MTAPQFDGENGCILEAQPYRIPARLHGPALTGPRKWIADLFKAISRRLERRERVVVVGQVRPDHR
jgi:hypothetical protein